MIQQILSKIKIKIDEFRENKEHNFFIKQNSLLQNADKIFTHLTSQEKRQLFKLSSHINDGFLLEIGSFIGASSCFLSAGLKKDSKVICVDTWKNDAMSEGKRDTMKEFDDNTILFKNKIIKVQGYSTKVKSKVMGLTNSIDLLFIDGDHSYEGCKADWDLYIDMVKIGGCVVFHDSGWADGVKKVIKENAKPIMSRHNSLPNMFWGYIK